MRPTNQLALGLLLGVIATAVYQSLDVQPAKSEAAPIVQPLAPSIGSAPVKLLPAFPVEKPAPAKQAVFSGNCANGQCSAGPIRRAVSAPVRAVSRRPILSRLFRRRG